MDHAELRQHVLPALLIAILSGLGSACATTTPGTSDQAPDDAAPSTWDELETRSKREIERAPALAEGSLLLENATVMTVGGETHTPGWLLVREGRIAALGAGPAPSDLGAVSRVDLGGRVLTPGLIDAHSHLGVYPSPPLSANRDGNEMTSPNTAG
ncbi:MAG TPA: hypothetical protein PK095_10400, partial [Myxococcota bacterium]|nr:hypothetical protein [Myxococcota bacterium]